MTIHVLPEDVVARIAAGEVVERPASVVKELLENAIDAGARTIRVDVNGGGRQLIRITDDGIGIPSQEVRLALARHATSKLRDPEDLYQIRTLGFRGEALASIVAVSRTTIITRHQDEEAGTQIRVEGGEIVSQRAVGAPSGTSITVENLFYNTPARLKFLKGDQAEKRQIATFVTRYAMAYPQLRMILAQDQQEIFRSSGSGNLGDVVVQAFGLAAFREMLEVQSEESLPALRSAIRVHGYVSQPDLHRKDRSRIILFVNGRAVQDTSLTYAVTQAYHTLLMKGRHPMAVLMIEVPPEFVDVNVHPTKAEVRFQDAGAVFAAVQRTVRDAVVMYAQTPSMRAGSRTRFAESRSSSGWVLPYDLPKEDAEERLSQGELGLEVTDPGQHPVHRMQEAEPEADLTQIPKGMGRPARPRTLPLLRVVGQVGAAYIVAEGPAGLYLIDQHAAHERILYEQFMEAYARQETMRQGVLATQVLDLPPIEARLVEEHLDLLNDLGFALEPFGPNSFRINSIPALLADQDPVEVMQSILADLEQARVPGQSDIEARIITHVCKRAAVKAGQILSYAEMQDLIRMLERCQSPHTCPHGRPTMLHMSGDQLAREFGRLGSH